MPGSLHAADAGRREDGQQCRLVRLYVLRYTPPPPRGAAHIRCVDYYYTTISLPRRLLAKTHTLFQQKPGPSGVTRTPLSIMRQRCLSRRGAAAEALLRQTGLHSRSATALARGKARGSRLVRSMCSPHSGASPPSTLAALAEPRRSKQWHLPSRHGPEGHEHEQAASWPAASYTHVLLVSGSRAYASSHALRLAVPSRYQPSVTSASKPLWPVGHVASGRPR
mmetsp:Transcript_29129/g.94678  ORF Transcript_29129/g.94678 Transcript_29129/m.94678 type:complete len:223 (-) Transcript_29129:1296-1964(-)